MKFKEISFENYRCFLNGTIKFSTNNNKNMTVLIGPNGSGKTETLFAFWWALYGFDFSTLMNKEQNPYALNADLYRKLQNGQIGDVESCTVTVTFEQDNIDYTVEKRCEYRKTEKIIKKEEYRTFSKTKENGELSLPIRDGELIDKELSRIIPKSILYGIIFDGERMQKLNRADENSVNAIKGVISDITNVELLEKCIQYFSSIKRKYNKELSDHGNKTGNTSLEEIILEIYDLEKQIDKNKQEHQQLLNSKDEIILELSKISDALEANKEVKQFEEKRKKLEVKLNDKEEGLDDLYKKFSDTVCELYLMASNKLLDDVNEIIDNYDVPEGLTVNAVKSILSGSSKKCICGRELDDKSIETLKALIKILPPDNIDSTLKEMIRGIRIRITEVKKTATESMSEIRRYEKEIKQLKDDISLVSTQILSLDPEKECFQNAIDLEKENLEYTKQKGRVEAKIEIIENDLKENKPKLDKLVKQRDSRTEYDSLEKKYNYKINFTERSIAALNEIREINKENALTDINTKLSKAYSELSEDYDRGREIRIIQYNEGHKYQMAVYMKDNYEAVLNKWKANGIYKKKLDFNLSEEEIKEEAIIECLDSNSTGQSKINAFSFVKAILDYSNTPKKENGIQVQKSYPLLIDAPFGDIASDNLTKSSNQLHSFAEQVILMIDEEKYEQLKSAFEPYISDKYYFEKVDGLNHSNIKESEV